MILESRKSIRVKIVFWNILSFYKKGGCSKHSKLFLFFVEKMKKDTEGNWKGMIKERKEEEKKMKWGSKIRRKGGETEKGREEVT